MSDEFALAVGCIVDEFDEDLAALMSDMHEDEWREEFRSKLDIIASLLIAHAKDKRHEIERLRFAFPDVFPSFDVRSNAER